MVIKKKKELEKPSSQLLHDRDADIITGYDNDSSSSKNRLVPPIGKFAILKYGNNEELIFNIVEFCVT